MIKARDLIVKFLEAVKAEGIQDLQAKGISRGDMGLAVTSDEESGELSGNSYWYFLVHGRGPGKQPPLQAMLDYVEDKPIQPRDKISLKSLAYLIGRKIGREGTDIFQGKKPAWALPEIFEKHKETFESDLDGRISEEIDETFTKSMRSIFGGAGVVLIALLLTFAQCTEQHIVPKKPRPTRVTGTRDQDPDPVLVPRCPPSEKPKPRNSVKP